MSGEIVITPAVLLGPLPAVFREAATPPRPPRCRASSQNFPRRLADPAGSRDKVCTIIFGQNASSLSKYQLYLFLSSTREIARKLL